MAPLSLGMRGATRQIDTWPRVRFGRFPVAPDSPPAPFSFFDHPMSSASHVLRLLDETLGLQGRAAQFDAQTPLLGALAELDSMAVVSLITALEEQLGISIGDDEIDGQTFATVGALTRFVDAKLAA